MSHGCERYEDALLERAAGRLDSGPVERLDAHLADCAECREALLVIRAVAGHPPAAPANLEAGILAAVRSARPAAGEVEAPAPAFKPRAPSRGRDEPRPTRRFGWVRPARWAVPLAAAAVVALVWIRPGNGPGTGVADGAELDYEPYGSWPASNGLVAGEPVLSELTVEELERLLEEMES